MTESRELLESILEDEDTLVAQTFTLDDAWRLGSALRAAALARSLPVTVGITLGDARVFYTALPGSSRDNDDWLAGKERVVRHFGHSSLAVGERFRADGLDFDTHSYLPAGEFRAHGGVFPIRLAGSPGVLGTVGVSGLPQRDDHDFVVEQWRAFLVAAAETASAADSEQGTL